MLGFHQPAAAATTVLPQPSSLLPRTTELHCAPRAAEFVDIGSGAAAGLTACACGYISTFHVGFLSIAGAPYVGTVGFTCSSGQQQQDAGATGLALSSSATTAPVRHAGVGL